MTSMITDKDVLSVEGGFSQITAQLGNPSAPGVVYISSDPADNQLTLQVIPDKNADLIASEPTPLSSAPEAKGSLFYISLVNMGLSADEFSALEVTAEGWVIKSYPDKQTLCFASAKDMTLKSGAGNGVSFKISKFALTKAPSSGSANLTMTYFRVDGFTYDNIGSVYSFKVLFQQNPNTHDKPLYEDIALSVSPEIVLTNADPKQCRGSNLKLTFKPGSEQHQVVAGKDTRFSLSFVYATDHYGYGALATPQDAVDFDVTTGLNASNWVITSGEDQQNPSWLLQPPSGEPILGTGPQATVSFDIGNIVSHFRAGPTLMLVSYSGVPGYQDGAFTILLEKVARAEISDFQVSPNPTYANAEGNAQVTVSWTVANATSLTLKQNWKSYDVTGKNSLQVDLAAAKTGFTLTATGPLADQGNQALKNITATLLPVINDFTGAPTEIFSAGGQQTGKFSWAVETVGSGQVKLSSTGSAFSGGGSYNSVASANANLNGPQLITLSPEGTDSPLALTRHLVISAFKPASDSYTVNGTPTAAVASPTAPFIAVSDSKNNLVNILDTVHFSSTQTVSVGHQPRAIGFSVDGSTMVVCNTGDKSFTPVHVNTDGTVFTPQSSVALDGSPQSLVVSPNGDRIYVVLDKGKGNNGKLVAFSLVNGQYQLDSSVDVQEQPCGMAVVRSGSILYVANSGSQSVSVVAIDVSGNLNLASIIEGLGQTPSDVALAADDSLLLVSCTGDSKVTAISTNHPNIGTRKDIMVGTSPTSIAVAPSGAYAYVCNSMAGTVSLLGCGNGSIHDVSVLGDPITVADNPSSISVTPDGLNVLVSNQGSSSINVLTLMTYKCVGNPVSIGNQMTNSVISPDTKQVFVWQNPLLGSHSTPGIIAFNTESQAQQSLLSNDHTSDCVFSPLASRNEAYALLIEDDQLHTINTATLAATASALPFSGSGKVQNKPLTLAISGDGGRLFVLYSDGDMNLSLLILDRTDDSWSLLQDVSLYQTSSLSNRLFLRVSPDGNTVLLVDSMSQSIHSLQCKNGQYGLNNKKITMKTGVASVTLLPDASKAYVLAAGGMNSSISVVDIAAMTARVITIPQIYVSLTSICSAPDGRRLYASDANSAALRVLDPQSLRILQTIKLTSETGTVSNPFGIAIAANASTLVVVNNGSNNMSIVEQISMQ